MINLLNENRMFFTLDFSNIFYENVLHHKIALVTQFITIFIYLEGKLAGNWPTLSDFIFVTAGW